MRKSGKKWKTGSCFCPTQVNVLRNNIGINYGFECINIRRVPRKVFEHEAKGWVFKHLPRDPANVNTLKTLVDRYSCINLMQFFFYRGILTFKMQEKCDTNLRHSVSLRSTDNFWKNRCSWMFCLCCFWGTVRARNVRRHDTNQMKRTRKYSGFSVIISALD